MEARTRGLEEVASAKLGDSLKEVAALLAQEEMLREQLEDTKLESDENDSYLSELSQQLVATEAKLRHAEQEAEKIRNEKPPTDYLQALIGSFGAHPEPISPMPLTAPVFLDRLSCTVVVDPGDVLIFTESVIHRTQNMKAATRSALSVEVF